MISSSLVPQKKKRLVLGRRVHTLNTHTDTYTQQKIFLHSRWDLTIHQKNIEWAVTSDVVPSIQDMTTVVDGEAHAPYITQCSAKKKHTSPSNTRLSPAPAPCACSTAKRATPETCSKTYKANGLHLQFSGAESVHAAIRAETATQDCDYKNNIIRTTKQSLRQAITV